ncbi:hypothetical protein [Mycolicibacterium sphagni]|uniref:Uncharacterized protein n=1 Tax=Mycolicibacterium sphagni TaxID=1786 RepID=A0ABX2JTK4_9MYCO|nr:hypothetical protein [Mycolicibacterium sphagni]NTY60139.1 hypothetical protein [Mycolicibacterium sphagni]
MDQVPRKLAIAAAAFAAIALSGSPIAAATPTAGVGGPSSYTGAATVNSTGGTASLGVGDVSSYTGGGTPGIAQNGTNSTTRTVNFGPGH